MGFSQGSEFMQMHKCIFDCICILCICILCISQYIFMYFIMNLKALSTEQNFMHLNKLVSHGMVNKYSMLNLKH